MQQVMYGLPWPTRPGFGTVEHPGQTFAGDILTFFRRHGVPVAGSKVDVEKWYPRCQELAALEQELAAGPPLKDFTLDEVAKMLGYEGWRVVVEDAVKAGVGPKFLREEATKMDLAKAHDFIEAKEKAKAFQHLRKVKEKWHKDAQAVKLTATDILKIRGYGKAAAIRVEQPAVVEDGVLHSVAPLNQAIEAARAQEASLAGAMEAGKETAGPNE